MDKDRLFFDIVIFIAASLVIFEAALRLNGFFAGIITAITIVRILNFAGATRRRRQGQ